MSHLVTALHVHGLRDHVGWSHVYDTLVRTPGVHDVSLSLSRALAVVRHDHRCGWPELSRAVHAGGCLAERATTCRRRGGRRPLGSPRHASRAGSTRAA